MQDDRDLDQKWTRRAILSVVLLTLTAMMHMCSKSMGCSPVTKKKEVAGPTQTGCGELKLGETSETQCPDGGLSLSVCTEAGLKAVTECKADRPAPKACDEVTTFDELQPVIRRSCLGSCHVGFDQLETATTKIGTFIERVNATGPQRMPKGGQLAEVDKALFASWQADGLLGPAECVPPGVGGGEFRNLTYLETRLSEDAAKLDQTKRAETAYLVALNSQDDDALKVLRDAANKAVNSVSVERQVEVLEEVEPGIFRVDLEAFGLEGKWPLIENASKLQLESFTIQGQILKALLQKRLPWLPVGEFVDAALRTGPVYDALVENPATFQGLVQKKGVDFARDLSAAGGFDALAAGISGSILTSGTANRLIVRHDSDDGFFWTTFDTGKQDERAEILVQNPLLVQSGGRANFKFTAGEVIYSLPNGMMGFALFAAVQVNGQSILNAAQNEAPVDVVHDFTVGNPLSPVIVKGISCMRCHANGIIHVTDEIRAGSRLSDADALIVGELFKPQSELDGLIVEDNSVYGEALEKLGLADGPDPITATSDVHLAEYDLAKTSRTLLLRPEELTDCLNLSDEGREQAGQLLSGGKVTFDTLVQVLPQLKVDCRLFQDPLGG